MTNENKTLYISRQSLQESLLPGLVCLKEIFQNNIISSGTGSSPSVQNEYVQQLGDIIATIEKMSKIQAQNTSQESPMLTK